MQNISLWTLGSWNNGHNGRTFQKGNFLRTYNTTYLENLAESGQSGHIGAKFA